MNQESNNASLVFIVDDDAAVGNSLKFSLELEGFAVRLYRDGAALLAAPDLADCACLVIDQQMPGLSGLQTLRLLRDRKVAVPAILTSGHPSAVVRHGAADAGIVFVEKPLLGNALIDGIRAAIRH